MYLSRLILNPRSRAVYRDLVDCQQMHRTITNAFPALASDVSAPRAESGVLFRVESGAMRAGPPAVRVLSRMAPNWQHLPSGYLLDEGPANPASREVSKAYAGIAAGAVLRFRLLANPTKRLSECSHAGAERSPGKRVQLFQEEDQIAWLRRKGEQAGFNVLEVRARVPASDERGEATAAADLASVRTGAMQRINGWRERGPAAGRDRLTFGAVLFEGLLRVSDAERFRAALASGIGSGKAYGFGLLSIAPASSSAA